MHRAHGAGELAHLQEELDGEALQLLAAELAVGEREPERVSTEGPPGLDTRDQILDEGLGGQNLAHLHPLMTRALAEFPDRPSCRGGDPIVSCENDVLKSG